jgi:iron complex transport system permease protein
MSTGTLGLLAGLGVLGDLGLSAAAIGGAALVMGLVMVIGQRVQNNMTLLILGLMFGYTTAAVVNVLIYFSVPGQVQSFINWTFGSFGGVTWSQLQILAPIIGLGLIVAYLLVKPLNALLLGEIYARSMGLTVGRARFWIIASASVLAGTVTAYCGPIAFLGVAIPHLCRSLFSTSDHRILLPSAMLMGALIALIADLVAEMPGSQALLPLNAITALIGAPIVVWIILHQRNLREAFAA